MAAVIVALRVSFSIIAMSPKNETCSALSLTIDFSGSSVQMLPSPSSLQGGSGSVYQPLGRGEDLPTSWEPNKVCWQMTSQVGVEGSSVVLGVEDASCEDLDSYCHVTACQAAIGGTVKVLDAGALAGGQ